MRWVAGMLIVLVAALPGEAEAQSPRGKQKVPNYYPLKPGTKWTCLVDAGNGKKVEASNQVTKNETIDGKSMALLETIVNGNVVSTEHLSSTAEGVFRCRYNGTEIEPPLCIFKYPMKEEAMWEAEAKIGPQQLKVKSTSGKLVEVTTPAGKYKAAPVVTETAVGGTKIKAKLWFAPEVGIVKQDSAIGEKNVNVELIKFEAAK
jgi:hypothetical protein